MPERDHVVSRMIPASVVQPTRRICVRRPLKTQQFLRGPRLSRCLISALSVARRVAKYSNGMQ